MRELTTVEGIPGWAELPAEQRAQVRALHAACKVIAGTSYKNIIQAYKEAALSMSSRGIKISWQTVQRKYTAWRDSGSLSALVDKRYLANKPSRARTSDPAFLAYWYALQTRCQRNGGQAYEILCRIWRNKEEVIPGYEDWPSWPSLPIGWSKANLMRRKPNRLELTVMRQGISAAASLTEMVLTTRVGVEAGEFYVSDDNWLDTYVVCGKQIVRPLQLGCIDIATGKMVHWGMMPRLMRDNGTHMGLSESYMRQFVAALLSNVGINTGKGTTLVVENGTAAIRQAMEEKLLSIFGGAVTVHRSGLEGKQQALLRGYCGQAHGNPRDKTRLESVWNLAANLWSSWLPAPSGHDRTPPEWIAGMKKEQEQLLKAQGYLEIKDPARVAMLRHLMPTFEQLTTDWAWRVYDAFNSRTDHNLEGWERMGLVVPQVRLSTDSEWITLSDSIPEEDRMMLLQMSSRDPERLQRARRMSPAEAWDTMTRRQSPLRRATQWEVVDLLSQDMAVKTQVQGAYIVLKNKAISADRYYYPSTIITPEGYERRLPSGMDVYVMPNIFDDKHLYLIDDRGRILGMATLQQRAPYYDQDAVRSAMGRKRQANAAALQETRVHHARKEAAIVETRIYNNAVAKGLPVTIPALLDAEQHDSDITPTPSEKRTITRTSKTSPVSVFAGLGDVPDPCDQTADNTSPEPPAGDVDLSSFMP